MNDTIKKGDFVYYTQDLEWDEDGLPTTWNTISCQVKRVQGPFLEVSGDFLEPPFERKVLKQDCQLQSQD